MAATKKLDIEALEKSGVLKRGSHPDLQIQRIPSGLETFDELIGGGIPRGRFIQLYGPESTGKTLLCQYIARAIQQTDYPEVVYFDLEKTFDEHWWRKTGVDVDKMIVTTPENGELAVDVMTTLLNDDTFKCGLFIIDSIAGLVPQAEMDQNKSATDSRQPGAQAQLITRMYQKTISIMGECTILMTNQMRESIGQPYASEMDALPGGRANRHYCHITLRTRRESWLNDPNGNHTGFSMEIISRKNKTCSVPDGTSVILPFDAQNQIDMIITYTNDGIEKKTIGRAGPYYTWAEQRWLGKAAMQQWFRENPEATEILKQQLYSVHV